jgi:propionyl-CoA carboxylase beta chain
MAKTNSYMFITGPTSSKPSPMKMSAKKPWAAPNPQQQERRLPFHRQHGKDCLLMIRELLGFLPSNNQEDPPFRSTPDDPLRRDKKLRDLVPSNPNRPYDMKKN